MKRACSSLIIALAIVLLVPVTAQAVITITFGSHLMLPTDSQTFAVLISTDAGEEISAADLYLQNGDGATNTNGPYITNVEMLTGAVFGAVSSSQTTYGDPYDVFNGTSNGLQVGWAAFCNATVGPNADVPASGVLAFVTWATNGAAPGIYPISLTSSDLGPSLLAKTTGLLDVGSDYFLVDGSIMIGPEPSSLVLALLAASALAITAFRRSGARRLAR